MTTVADLLIDRLIDWGVDTIFSLPGDGINGIYEALRTRQDRIKLVLVRHEESAALAACGYAKFTRRLGVCLATSGPGGIHLLNGLYDAKCDGQPVLAITGHTFHDLIGTHYQQDVNLDKLFSDVAAYSERVMGPAHVGNVVDEAIKTAISRRTVAHLTIPKDVQDWSADTQGSKANVPGHSGDLYSDPLPLPSQALLEKAAALLNDGTKIAILAGRGCLGARAEILELADKLGAPIVKPLLGKGVVPDDHPLTTGGIGLLGTAPSQEVLETCDALLIAGSSFPYLEFYPKPGQARAVQIDLDASRIGLRYPIEVGLVGQCWDVLRALLPLIRQQLDRRFLEQAQARTVEWNDLLEARGTRADVPLKPQVVVRAVNEFLADDAIICCDTGTVTTWVARHIRVKGNMEFSASGTLATMANGLPYSLGAGIAFPGRQVVCIAGDGGFSMLMSELATLVKYALPVKIIVLKNNLLGMIKWEQLAFEGNPQYGVDLQPIDFAACARSCGATGLHVEDPADVRDVLRQAFALPGPVVVEAVVDPSEAPLPGKITMEQAWQFTKAMARGQDDRWELVKNLVVNRIREVV
ncbi:MAG: putative thiamine pyrophosphate-containing protein YdaP [Nitrospirae bacterium]|nr:putative thiamine pyrophosphate-containing protein YdaP [Nitrospirota bacterium]MCK6493421.1 thiamine pyrophosphate-dependent enzyme [Nitrospira sp.]MEB2338933.1 thiamine pyrophosphate-binding protein [Nitrospirales bacterium]MCK6497873.1 thiamine pyrophosphate-dependent enzyme [Nitrospira sp.]QOJ34355.1 MAG: pyruvate oxidase [Nitrospira sp.]